MKRLSIYLVISLISIVPLFSQATISLNDCREMAIKNNKTLKMEQENVKAAQELKRAAFCQFLPNFSANGTYTRNQKDISLLSEDQNLPVYATNADGTMNLAASVNNSWTQVNGTYVPLDANGNPFDPTTSPEKLIWKNYAILPKSAMEFDIKNVYSGSIGFVQPIFMGGKIRALYNIAKYGENLAKARLDDKTTDLLLQVDEAYWRVVSIENKFKLSKEYCDLLSKMDSDVSVMIQEGVATKADGLKVKVKLNEAQVIETKAENGLSLSRMALDQLCGLPLDSVFVLQDENLNRDTEAPQLIPIDQAISNRPEIRELNQMENIAKSHEKLMVSKFLPTIGLTGGYTETNPNIFDGYTNKFGGMYSFSVVAHIPLFHFGENIHTLKAAKAQRRIANLKLEDTKEKIELQIKQNSFKVAESIKERKATRKNIQKAEENLKCANDGFEEGVITSTDLLSAQTAWLSAKSENIDAEINVRLCKLYLEQSLGTLEIPTIK